MSEKEASVPTKLEEIWLGLCLRHKTFFAERENSMLHFCQIEVRGTRHTFTESTRLLQQPLSLIEFSIKSGEITSYKRTIQRLDAVAVSGRGFFEVIRSSKTPKTRRAFRRPLMIAATNSLA